MRWLLAVCGVLFLFGLGASSVLDAAEEKSLQVQDPESTANAATSERSEPGQENQRVLTLLAIYCSLIVLASLFGGWIPNWVELTHTRMQTLISFVGGLMLGIAVFHLLPHSLEYTDSPRVTCQWLMGGLLVMFFLVRAFHFHHHGPADPLSDQADHHDHDHDDGHDHHSPSIHHLNWVGVASGLAIHTLIDGIALGASVRAEVGGPVVWSLFGLGTFLAVLLHKPLDAISITLLMAGGGWSAGARNAVNAGFAMMCPVGALLFVLGLDRLSSQEHYLLGCARWPLRRACFCASHWEIYCPNWSCIRIIASGCP